MKCSIIYYLGISFLSFWNTNTYVDAATLSSKMKSISEKLAMGDEALMMNDAQKAIKFYEEGIKMVQLLQFENKDDQSISVNSLPIVEALSMYTNLGTAYSLIAMKYNQNSQPSVYQEKTIQAYRDALTFHQQYVSNSSNGSDDIKNKEFNLLAAQAAFFLGMEYQDIYEWDEAVNAYALAYTLDSNHWASMANLGSLFFDYNPAYDPHYTKNNNEKKTNGNLSSLSPSKRMEESLTALNKAYQILTQTTEEPTDYPEQPDYMLSQLQYRIGMILVHDSSRKCFTENEIDSKTTTTKEVDCTEMAIHAFSLAVQYDSTNEPAKHMLAANTADATVNRASNQYVTELFEQYAKNFEHSLVDELGYNGYERLRRGFDRAYGGQSNTPVFPMVIDAGCGTGLVGEQFRNVSQYLIGADLSASIIQEAQKLRPNLYDDIYVGDVTDLFKRHHDSISLIVAADSFIYFGDLVPLFQSISKGLMSNGDGVIAFTLENVSIENEESLRKTKPHWRWQLTPSGRFAHHKEYVEYVADSNMMEVVHYETLDGFRYEKGIAVRGHLFVMKTKMMEDREL